MGFGLLELSEAIRRYADENLPGRTPLRFLLVTNEDKKPIRLPILGQRGHAPESPPETSQSEEKGRGNSPVVRDILKTIREVGRPLTKTRLLDEMAARGMEWSERAVGGWLARLVDEGTLDNPEEARPRGYRLPEWEDAQSLSADQ